MSKKILKNSELEGKIGSAKKTAPALPGSGLIRREEIAAREKGGYLIAEAEKDADRIRKEAEKIKARIEAEMKRKVEEGLQEGKEEGLATFTKEIKEARELKRKIIENAEPEIMKLVFEVAEKVVGDLVHKHKDAVRAIVHQALEHSLGDKITVRMNPADLIRLSEEDRTFKDVLDRTKHIYFKEDESIDKGGCIVETEIGTIDAQLDTQLKAIRKALGV